MEASDKIQNMMFDIVASEPDPAVEALKKGGNKDYTTKLIPRLNHLFQHATTGSPTEYAQIEETMAPQVLETVSNWILERFGPGR